MLRDARRLRAADTVLRCGEVIVHLRSSAQHGRRRRRGSGDAAVMHAVQGHGSAAIVRRRDDVGPTLAVRNVHGVSLGNVVRLEESAPGIIRLVPGHPHHTHRASTAGAQAQCAAIMGGPESTYQSASDTPCSGPPWKRSGATMPPQLSWTPLSDTPLATTPPQLSTPLATTPPQESGATTPSESAVRVGMRVSSMPLCLGRPPDKKKGSQQTRWCTAATQASGRCRAARES